MASDGELVIGQREAANAALLALEARKAHALTLALAAPGGPEVGERGGEIGKSALDRALGHLVDPGELLTLDRVEALLERQHAVGRLAGVECLLDLSERPVIREAGGATRFAEVD